uniref:Uncharacterized protein n=1 Tax=Setaria digitata TaxID=48799 RepID=A0A915PMA1_9BILA
MLKIAINKEKICIPDKYEPTIFDFDGYQYTDTILGQICFKIFDTPGMSCFDRLRQLIYLDANIAVICYSVDSRQSFWNARHRWYDEIRYGFCPKGIPIILAATKTDLRNDSNILNRLKNEGNTIISTEEGKQLAECIEAYAYSECTSKDRKSILELFREALKAYCNFGKLTQTENTKNIYSRLKRKLEYHKIICTVC